MIFKAGQMSPSVELLRVISRTLLATQRTDGAAVFPGKDRKMNNLVKDQFRFTKLKAFKGQGLSY